MGCNSSNTVGNKRANLVETNKGNTLKSEPKGKRVLVVYAHPNPKSYTAAMKDTIMKTLTDQGFSVKISDLYDMKFDPVASKKDFVEVSNKEYFSLLMEQRSDKLAPELASEVQKLVWCDYLITVFPFWWSSPPAILNGWFDRVLTCGKAWDFGKVFDQGLLKGKKGLVITSVGSPNEYYQPGQMSRHTVKRRLFFITHGTFGFCGMTPLEPIHLHSANAKEDSIRKTELDGLADTLKGLDKLPAMDYEKL